MPAASAVKPAGSGSLPDEARIAVERLWCILLLLFAGGYDALSECMVVVAFPIAVVLLLMCLSVFKFLFHREEYDATYREELAEERAREQAEFDERVEAAARHLLDG